MPGVLSVEFIVPFPSERAEHRAVCVCVCVWGGGGEGVDETGDIRIISKKCSYTVGK